MITARLPLHPRKATLLVNDPRTIWRQLDDDPIGPDTFFVSGDTVTIQDRVNDVLSTYRDGKRVDTVKIPAIQCCADMLIQNDLYWLLDSDHTLYKYRRAPGAHRLTELHRYDVGGSQARSVETEGGSIVVQMFDFERLLVVGPGPTHSASFDMHPRAWDIDDGTIHVRLNLRWEAWDIALYARTADSSYYGVWDIKPGSDLGAKVPNGGYLYQISNSNQLLRTFTMMNHGSVVPSRDIRVTDDGTVYQMIRTEQSTKVYRLEPNPAFGAVR